MIAGRFAATIAEHGPDAVALYVSGQFLTEDYCVANKLMKGFIQLPPRDALATLLGGPVDAEMRMSLLAGRTGVTGMAGAARIICACFGVGLHTLDEAIAHRNLTSVAEIGAALRAGTNCGSCRPELNALLQRATSAVRLPTK